MKITLTVENKIKVNEALGPVRSDKLWTYAATQWYRLYKDWVPMKNGPLYQNVLIRPKEIIHLSPYAHYDYIGIAYGHNIPISENGVITGFFYPRNRPKSPTGRKLKFSRQQHPKACAKWDQAAAPVQLPKLVKELQRYVDSGRL